MRTWFRSRRLTLASLALGWRALALVLVPILVLVTLGLVRATADADRIETYETTVGVLEPVFPGAEPAAPQLSPEEMAALEEKYLEQRELIDAQVDNNPKSPPGLKDVPVEETALLDAAVVASPAAPTDMYIKGATNNVVPIAPSFKSDIGEPAVANMGKKAFYTGNTFASYSTNDGGAWSNRALPAPPPNTSAACCDQDVEVDQGRNRVFWSILYLNGTGTNGVVKIAVLPSPSSAPICEYDLPVGTNRVPDYPHIGLSNDFLYLSRNVVDVIADTWISSDMLRIDLDQLAACQTATFWTFRYEPPTYTAQRVFVPVEGAEDRMYWAVLANTTTMRIFEWPETSTSVSSVTRSISASTHTNPDCRGGANNTDWIEESTAWSITGFRMRGWYGQPPGGGGRDVVGFVWNVAPDAHSTMAHTHGAVFDADTKSLVSQPNLVYSDRCNGYPDVAVTERGHPGIILAYGGRPGGGGLPVGLAVGLGDDTVSGWGPTYAVANGTHNPANGRRWGDYFTMQQHEPCDLFLVAGGYVLVNGTAGSNAVHRYFEFGRQRDKACWDLWRLQP